MSAAPHEQPAFVNAAEYTVSISFVVAGGARPRTAERRAAKVAERLANTAARAAGVVEIRAVVGRSRCGQIGLPQRVRFDAANTGTGTYAEPDKLDRYLDPDHERALTSLEAANTAFRARRVADERRRQAVGCRNSSPSSFLGEAACGCVYCQPDEHLLEVELARASAVGERTGRCLCSARVDEVGMRCGSHRGVSLEALDGDPAPLEQLASALHDGSTS